MVETLSVRDLDVTTRTGERLLSNLTFTIAPGERVGLIGASGSGKSLTAAALCGLLRPPLAITKGRVTLGHITLGGKNLRNPSPRDWRKIRGRRIFQIFQSPGTALTPAMRIGPQLAEAAQIAGAHPDTAIKHALKCVLLTPGICTQFPYQLSGGMKQRVLIAMALILRPDILIADEPTTGLDVITEAEVLSALNVMIAETGASLLFISHDLRAVQATATRLLVVDSGTIVEQTRDTTLNSASHPATRALAPPGGTLGQPGGTLGQPGKKLAPPGKKLGTTC